MDTVKAFRARMFSAVLWEESMQMLISYDPENCRLVGRIVNVSADESVLGENGKVDAAKLQPITYDPMNHHYLALGEKVGQAFHDGLILK